MWDLLQYCFCPIFTGVLKSPRGENMKDIKISEIKAIFREVGEENRKLQESVRETNKLAKHALESARENRIAIQYANGNFNLKWGHFLENLIEGDLVSLLQNWGFKNINEKIQPIPNVTASNEDGTDKYELDLIVKNGDFAFIVEVKTTLRVFDVDVFVGKLKELKDDFPAYKDKEVYGCMAYINVEKKEVKNPETKQVEIEDGLAYAQEKGLITIRAPGGPCNIATITNPKGFVPKTF